MKKTLFKNDLVHIEEDSVTEGEKTFNIIRIGRPSAIVVLPLLNESTIVMEKQFRPVIKKYINELPAGKIEGDEDLIQRVKNELEEELGLRAKNITLMFETFGSPGLSDYTLHYYLATGIEKGERHLGEDEVIDMFEIDMDEALKWIRDGKIMDNQTISCLLYYDTFLRDRKSKH